MTINVTIKHDGGPYDFDINRRNDPEIPGQTDEHLATLTAGDEVQVAFWKGVKLEFVEVDQE